MVFGTANLVQTRTINKANEITGITNTTGGAWGTPTYDLVGNTTKTPSVEAPTDSGKDRQLTYDAWNRVVKVTDSSTSGFDPNTLAFYGYDARGFRLTNQRYSGVGTAADWLTHYYYTAGWQCIEERVVDLTVTQPASAVLSAQYVWGLRYVDDLIQRQRDTTGDGVLDETLYALTDRQFNVIALTDTSQTIVQRMSYTPYGEVSFLTSAYASSTNTKDWEQLFQGLRLDQTWLYDNRTRIVDALTGRFMQNDPAGYPDGMNRYAAYHVMYAEIDPYGLKRDNNLDKVIEQFLKEQQINNLQDFQRRKRELEENIKQIGDKLDKCRYKAISEGLRDSVSDPFGDVRRCDDFDTIKENYEKCNEISDELWLESQKLDAFRRAYPDWDFQDEALQQIEDIRNNENPRPIFNPPDEFVPPPIEPPAQPPLIIPPVEENPLRP